MEQNKESEVLEALERIANKRKITFGDIVCDNISLKNDYKKVKNALTRLEKLEAENKELKIKNFNLDIAFNIVASLGKKYPDMFEEIIRNIETGCISTYEEFAEKYKSYDYENFMTKEQFYVVNEAFGNENC